MIRTATGKLTYTAGNGNNYLQLATPFPGEAAPLTPSPVFNVNIHFGNGNDTFLLGYPPVGPPSPIAPAFPPPPVEPGLLDQGGVLTGQVIAGTGTNNVFIQGMVSANETAPWVLAPNFTLAGFP
jgi:hypothetical protein